MFSNPVILTLSMIGDGYCDCHDTGYDEFSHTSACSHIQTLTDRFQCSVSSSHPQTLVPIENKSRQQILHSRVNDTICDCCDGSDERSGLCPNTCSSYFLQSVNSRKASLHRSINGFNKYKSSLEESEKKQAAAKAKHNKLLEEEIATFKLANLVAYYKGNEKSHHASKLPRYDYALQGARLRQIRGGEENISNELKAVLRTKCPTRDFTLQDFIATVSLKLDSPQRTPVHRRTNMEHSLPWFNNLLVSPSTLALHVVGAVCATPVKALMYGIGWAWEKYGIEFPEPVDKKESEALSLQALASVLSPINLLVKLGEINPALDYRKYKWSRKSVNAVRRTYSKYFLTPLGTIWEGPEALYNVTLIGASAIMKDPDTHEYRLLVEAGKAIAAHKKVIKNKIDASRKILDFDYGPLYVIADICFNAPIDKYSYRVCPLKDVRQDATKLGNFAGWLGEERRRYKIDNGSVCHGVTSVDTNGNSFQMKRSGTISFECGDSHSILSVTENQPCVYEVQMQTFLVCDDDELKTTTKDLEDFILAVDDSKITGGKGIEEMIEEAKNLIVS